MKNQNTRIRKLTEGALIATLYVVLTLVFAPISFGPLQLRIAEMLTILPLFTPAAIPGLFVGCVLANLLGGAILWDVVFGSIATLIGAFFGWLLRRNRWLVPIPAIVANALIVPFVLWYGYGFTDTAIPLLIVYIAIGEILGCFVLGEALANVLLKYRNQIFKD